MHIFSNILSIFFLIIICFIPVLLWGYFFSFQQKENSRKRFFYGILAGGISTIPVLGLEYVYTNIFPSLNVFSHTHGLSDISSYGNLMLSLAVIIFFIGLLFLIIRKILLGKRKFDIYNYIKTGFFYITGIISLAFIFFILSLVESSIFSENSFIIADAPVFMGYAFNSLKLVIMYYFVIAFLEEGTKYFAFLSGVDFSTLTGKSGILFALNVALGFAFFENILYALSLFSAEGFTNSLVAIIFYRSIFSLFIHVLASIILSYYVSKLYELGKYSYTMLMKHLMLGVMGALVIHASYDITIVLGWTGLIFLYFIGGYLYVSKLIFSNK